MKRQAYILSILITITTSCLSQNSDKFIFNCYKGKYLKAYRYLSEEVKPMIKPKDIRDVFRQLEGTNGQFKSYSFNCEKKTSYGLTTYFTMSFEKMDIDIKIVLNESDRIRGFFVVPIHICKKINRYSPPNSKGVIQKKISIFSPEKKDSISVFFTQPKNEPYSKIVLFVPGSGPVDENSTIGQTKLFLDLSIELARQGIASVRFKKFQNLNCAPNQITFHDEYLVDISSILNFLNKELSSKRKYILGHSLGGLAISQYLNDFDGGIYLSCNLSPLDSLIISQTKYIFNLDSTNSKTKKNYLRKLQAEQSIIRNTNSNIPDTSILLGAPLVYWKSLNELNSNVLISNSINTPKLFLMGGRDYQVPIHDFRKFGDLVEGHSFCKFITFSNLNHVFIHGKGTPSPQEYETPGNVSVQVVDAIIEFLESY